MSYCNFIYLLYDKIPTQYPQIKKKLMKSIPRALVIIGYSSIAYFQGPSIFGDNNTLHF